MRLALKLVGLALALGAFVAYAAGCRAYYIPDIPSEERSLRIFRAQPLVPEGWYRVLHEDMERCVGIERPYDDIEWYVVPAGAMGSIGGLTSWPNRIYLDERHVISVGLIAHELLHYITRLGHDGSGEFERILAICVY